MGCVRDALDEDLAFSGKGTRGNCPLRRRGESKNGIPTPGCYQMAREGMKPSGEFRERSENCRLGVKKGQGYSKGLVRMGVGFVVRFRSI